MLKVSVNPFSLQSPRPMPWSWVFQAGGRRIYPEQILVCAGAQIRSAGYEIDCPKIGLRFSRKARIPS
jgi:hypothetical protein